MIVDEIRAVAEGLGPARVRENAEAANLVLSDADRKRLDDFPPPRGRY